MFTAMSNWRRERRYRTLVRELKGLSPEELNALGIARSQITHLAEEVSVAAGTIQTNRPIIGALVAVGFIALWRIA